jgi:Mg-chelatase subunit ChlD
VTVEFQPFDGVPVALAVEAAPLDGQSGPARQTAILAVDKSGSLGEDNMAAVREAANAFLDTAPASVEVGLVTFGDPAERVISRPRTGLSSVNASTRSGTAAAPRCTTPP